MQGTTGQGTTLGATQVIASRPSVAATQGHGVAPTLYRFGAGAVKAADRIGHNLRASIPAELVRFLSERPDVMGGEVCFLVSRVPVRFLLDNMRAGVPVEEFLANYPDVGSEAVQAVLDWEDAHARSALGIERAS